MDGFYRQMKDLINKFFAKPYTCCMEIHNQYGCYISIHHPSIDSIDGYKEFFKQNNFLIAHNMFDEEWEEKIQIEEIYKKLLLIYEFDPKNQNLIIVYKNHKRVYLPNNTYVRLHSRSVFVYDSSKLTVSF